MIFFKYLLIISFFNIIVQADNNINDIVQEEYKYQGISNKFDNHVDDVISIFKENTNYFKKLGANNGLYVERQAKDITNQVMKLYSQDIDVFVKTILSNSLLFEKIQDNYNEYINKGSHIIYQEVDSDFQDKFLNIYNSNNLEIMLKDDINEKISSSKNKILKKLEENVANGQLTLGQMAVGAIAVGVIAKTVGKRIILKAAARGLLKWVPALGWGLATYDLLTVNKLYDTISKEIKIAFHQNETLILSKISNELVDINNISSTYKQDISDITFDFIKKAKPIYLSTENNLELRSKILNSDNYTYLQFSETFYQVPIEYYEYLATKFLSLSLKEMEYFNNELSKLNDIYIFDNIKYFENKHNFNIKIDNFFALTKLFNEFNTQGEIDLFFRFTKKIFKKDNLMNKHFIVSLTIYDILKSENSLFQDKYISMLTTSSKIVNFNKFLSSHINEVKAFNNQDILLLNKLSLNEKEQLILNPIYFKYKIYIIVFIFLVILLLTILFYKFKIKQKQINKFNSLMKYKWTLEKSNLNKLSPRKVYC